MLNMTSEDWADFQNRAKELHIKRLVYEESDEYKQKESMIIHKEAVAEALRLSSIPNQGWLFKGIDNGVLKYSKCGLDVTYDVRDSRKRRPIIGDGWLFVTIQAAFKELEHSIGAQDGYFFCNHCELSRGNKLASNSEWAINYTNTFDWIVCKECDKKRAIRIIEAEQKKKDKATHKRNEQKKTKNVLAVFNLMRSKQHDA